MIDYRSDTVTRPTQAMLDAMHAAPVGDDVFEDDPSINALQEKAAAMFGKEAALFAPSGTMTNQIAIKVHTQPGDEVVCDALSHIYHYEGGGIAFNSGCSVKLLNGDRGRFSAEMVQQAVQPDDPHFPRTRLVSAENTCNKGGGVIWDPTELDRIADYCRQEGLSFHLDGARLFNALVETGQSPNDVGKTFDSISICMSKGLGCPVGSLLIGDRDFIHQARRVRKVFGGGMRQAGYLAAAASYALDHHITRLKDDHNRAKTLANVFRALNWVAHVEPPQTNIVVIELADGIDQKERLQAMEKEGIRAVGFGAGKIRLVTHLDITDDMIDQTASVVRKMAG